METAFETKGLTTKDATALLATHGRNEVAHKVQYSAFTEFLVEFRNPLVFILVFASIVSAFLGDWTSSVIIIVIVLASTVLDFVNTYKSQRAAELLRQKVAVLAHVFRDGVLQEIALPLLVPGDSVYLSAGDVIPADGKIVQEKNFYVNESSLTGESFPVQKPADGELFLGTSVISGNAIMEITATGAATKFGAIAKDITAKSGATEFDKGIASFSYLIMRITFVLVIGIFFINALFRHNVLEAFLFSAALAVGLTPELLPMIIALNLSKGSMTMSHHGVIVKRLSSIQNFGSMDLLCTDKTGTLTEDHIALITYVDIHNTQQEEIFTYSFISSTFRSGFNNALDTAVKNFKTIDIADVKKLDEIPFDFTRKRDSVIVLQGSKKMLVSKGAPEEMQKVCSTVGLVGTQFDANEREQYNSTYAALSKEGYRVLAVAKKDLPETQTTFSTADETDMQFVGFIAFLDPAKKSVSETLERLEEYGITIKIITGDNELVTQKIAREIGLPVQGVLMGSDMDTLNDLELAQRIEQCTMFARVLPEQKKRLIELFRKNGHVVGYMGDGINDAPSLRAADVGISVNNAVDVAKESADLILLKKSLKDLVNGVVEGRKIFANTMKYLKMALSSNFGNMFSVAGASLVLPFLPMLPTQILLNNLLYDGSQFAIALDNVDAERLTKPRRMDMHFVKKFMLVFGPISSLFDFLTFMSLYFVLHLPAAQFQTGWFIESLTTQALVIFAIRTRRLPFFTSKPRWILTVSTFAVVAVGWVLAFTPAGHIFGFKPLPWTAVLAIVVITILYLATVELVKHTFYKTQSHLEHLPIQKIKTS